jgi:hypothetical protein
MDSDGDLAREGERLLAEGVRVADVGEDDLVTPTTWLEIRDSKSQTLRLFHHFPALKDWIEINI